MSVAGKLGFKNGGRSIVVNAPANLVKAIAKPAGSLEKRLLGEFGYIHVFVRSRRELDARFPMLKRHLRKPGVLWISWPKAGLLGTDLSLPKVIEIGYRHGMVESKTISVDATWSAMKFTFPKDGKVYHNSYGRLPARGG